MNTTDLIKEGNLLFERIDKRDTHLLQDYSLNNTDDAKEIVDLLTTLLQKIPEIDKPESVDEVYLAELKRQCVAGIQILNEQISPNISEPNAVIEQYSVKKDDIDKIKDWLLANKENIIHANYNQYEKYANIKKSDVPLGDPRMRQQAEALLLDNIEIIKSVLLSHRELSLHFSKLFKEYLISVDSANNRSHASRIGKIALISTSGFTFLSNGKLDVELHSLLAVFGHEVLGHAANFMLTDSSDKPFYIKWGFPELTSSTRESVSDYFEKQIFSYLKECSGINDLFSNNHTLEDTYNCFNDTRYLIEYQKKIHRLGIWVLSQTKMDDTQQQLDELSKYSIQTKWPANFVNYNRNNWNKATGLLLPKVVSELRYCVEVINDMKIEGLNTKPDFDIEILEGMWTPRGMADYMKYSAQIK